MKERGIARRKALEALNAPVKVEDSERERHFSPLRHFNCKYCGQNMHGGVELSWSLSVETRYFMPQNVAITMRRIRCRCCGFWAQSDQRIYMYQYPEREALRYAVSMIGRPVA